jgi:methylglutamate dehydrogenase subunit D
MIGKTRNFMPEPPPIAADGEKAVLVRASALARVALPGRFGADKGDPGIELSVRHPASIVTVIARKGGAGRLADILHGLAGCNVHWAGFEQYYVVAEDCTEGSLYRELKDKLDHLASVSEQSHGRIIIRVAGPKSRSLLAKGTPVDLHTDVFPVGKSAVTQMAHVGVHLTRTGENSFELSVFRGFAESFWEWLTEQAEEFGYRIA